MSRKMIKWAPFASLKEQAIVLNKTKEEMKKIDKPELSEDQINEINLILTNYKGETLNITYYRDGYLLNISSIIKKIDVNNKKLVTPNQTIMFDELVSLN